MFPVALGDFNGMGQLGSGFEGNSGSRSLTWTLEVGKMEPVVVSRGDEFIRNEKLPHIDILKLDVEGYEKRVLIGLREILLKERPVILMEMIGTSEKGGFRDATELRETLYPAHELFALQSGKKARLSSFSWHEEALVCLPEERVSGFRTIIS
jgi:hypothetical protein